MTIRYLIDGVRIFHERLNDEVIIINSASGAYYSGSGTFADVWTLLAGGATAQELVEILAAAYGGDAAVILADTEKCICNLVSKELVAERPDARTCSESLALPVGARNAWTTPSFEEYTDMWDLIQLDPIHDVGEAGWPFASPESKF